MMAKPTSSKMLVLSKTFEVVTEESAENGEAEESGYAWENVAYTFREAVDLIKSEGFSYGSDSHGAGRWLSTEPNQDYRTGDWTTYSLHPARDAQSLRYWEKACKAAGVVK